MNHFLPVSKTSLIIRIVWRCTWLRLSSYGTVITRRWRASAWRKWLHSNTRLTTRTLRWRDSLLVVEFHRNNTENNNHDNSSYDPHNNTSDGSARQTIFFTVSTVVAVAIIVVIWAISASWSSCT